MENTILVSINYQWCVGPARAIIDLHMPVPPRVGDRFEFELYPNTVLKVFNSEEKHKEFDSIDGEVVSVCWTKVNKVIVAIDGR